jgi:hypothetical protein
MKQVVLRSRYTQVKEIERATAAAVSEGEQKRNATTWQPLSQVSTVAEAAPLIESNRERLWRVLGKVENARLPVAPRARHLPELSTEGVVAFEVCLDVFPAVFAWGILLVPTDALSDSV